MCLNTSENLQERAILQANYASLIETPSISDVPPLLINNLPQLVESIRSSRHGSIRRNSLKGRVSQEKCHQLLIEVEIVQLVSNDVRR